MLTGKAGAGSSGSEGRFAVYHAPPDGSALADLAGRWLGRDVRSGAPMEPPTVPGLDPARIKDLTESPRFYGFHGTLKAPFALAGGTTPDDLITAVDHVAAGQATFTIPALTVASLGGFLALVPSGPAPDLAALAAVCVERLDPFRAQALEAEAAKRRAAGLTPTQQALLDRWGYPYVMDAFRFHMTLTGRIEDAGERAAVTAALTGLFAPVLGAPEPVTGLAVFHQPDRKTPFRLIHRAPFGG